MPGKDPEVKIGTGSEPEQLAPDSGEIDSIVQAIQDFAEALRGEKGLAVSAAFSEFDMYRSRFMQTANEILSLDGIDIEVKAQTIIGILKHQTVNLGRKRPALEGADGRPTWSSLEYMQKMLALINALKDFFGNLFPEEEYNYFLRKIAEELKLAFKYYEFGHNTVLWQLDHDVKRLDLLNQLAGQIEINDLDEIESLARQHIPETLRELIELWFYREQISEDQAGRKRKMLTIANRLQIDLPSEKEIYERDVQRQMKALSQDLQEWRTKVEKGDNLYELDKNRKSVNNGFAFFREAAAKYPDIAIPNDYDSMEAMVVALENEFSQIIAKSAENEIRKIFATFKKAIADKNLDLLGHARSNLEQQSHKIRNNPDLSKIKADLIQELESYLVKLKSEIESLADAIKSDPSQAGKLADQLKNLSEAYSAYSYEIKEFNL